MNISVRRLSTFAEAASQVYEKTGGKNALCFWEAGDAEAALYKDSYVPGEFILTFRGTEPSEISDVMADIDVKAYTMRNGTCHNGFFEYLDSLMPAIDRDVHDMKIHVVGHSLGGAMALLYCVHCMERNTKSTANILSLTTFGQPRALNTALAKWFMANKTFPYTRFVNDRDLVARIPLRYTHCGTQVVSNDDGKFSDTRESIGCCRLVVETVALLCSRRMPECIADHCMDQYHKVIELHATTVLD